MDIGQQGAGKEGERGGKVADLSDERWVQVGWASYLTFYLPTDLLTSLPSPPSCEAARHSSHTTTPCRSGRFARAAKADNRWPVKVVFREQDMDAEEEEASEAAQTLSAFHSSTTGREALSDEVLKAQLVSAETELLLLLLLLLLLDSFCALFLSSFFLVWALCFALCSKLFFCRAASLRPSLAVMMMRRRRRTRIIFSSSFTKNHPSPVAAYR